MSDINNVMQRVEEVTETIAAVKGEDYAAILKYALVIGMNQNFSVAAGMNRDLAFALYVVLSRLLSEHAVKLGVDLAEETARVEFTADLTTVLRAFTGS